MKRLAVVGQPIAHSLSPQMQNAALAELGLADGWSYEAIELSPERFQAGVGELVDRGFVGANVTIPHKQAALRAARERSAAAVAIGAANTLSFTAEGIVATNTDAPGFLAALPEAFDPATGRALVYGAGGSARAVCWALLRAGAELTVRNRTLKRGRELVADLGAGAAEPLSGSIRGFDLIVNATSIGLASPGAPPVAGTEALKALGISADQLDESLIVVDLVYGSEYGSEPTGLLVESAAAGATVVDGLEILVRQGAESLRIWTGLDPPIDVMRQAVRQRRG